jgi:hypothetical protein
VSAAARRALSRSPGQLGCQVERGATERRRLGVRAPAAVRRILALATILATSAACGLPEAPPLVRVVGAEPEGTAVPPEGAAAAFAFSAPVSAEGLSDGRRLVLAPADALRVVLDAVESEQGAVGLAEAVAASIALEAGGARVVLRPAAPLRARTSYALVLSSRAHDPDGRPVLDAEGRRRASVATFQTGAAAGPPPFPVITEVRADAATPEAGGEYVELANLGEGPLDLYGHRLAKRTATGAISSCALPPDAVIAPGAVALVVGGAYDGRYTLPPGVDAFACGATALVGGLANDRPPEVLLLGADGATLATFGQGGSAPLCPAAAVHLDPAAPDEAWNLACAEADGTPGRL